MPNLSLTDFVDVVSKAGSPKATKVSEIKNRENYSPATDFYKRLREGLIDIHKRDETKDALQSIVNGLTDEKKIANYPPAIAGYRKWWGKKQMKWFNPPTSTYSMHEFNISINPELGLEINGQRHVIKLYLKDERLTKFRVGLITCLMQETLAQEASPNTSMCVLDVRAAKLHYCPSDMTALMRMVEAELSYVAALWPHV